MNYLSCFVRKYNIEILIALVILMQNPFWPFWNVGHKISFFLIFLLAFSFYKKKRLHIPVNFRIPIVLLIISFIIFPFFRSDIHLSNILYILCFVIAYSFKYDESFRILDSLCKILGFVVLFSLPAWLLHISGIYQFPLYSVLDLSAYKSADMDEGQADILNYFLFVMNGNRLDVFRFYCLFDEPGVLGTLSAYLLYSQRYDFTKWYNLSILLGCIFSFSMAFYALSFIGYMSMAFKSKEKFMVVLLGGIIFFSLAFFFLMQNDVFYDLIYLRGTNLSESLESRSSGDLDSFLSRASFFDIMLGIGTERLYQNNLLWGASYKLFLAENGLLAMFSLIYVYIKLNHVWSWDVIIFNIMFWLSFLQRPTALQAWQIFLFSMITMVVGQKYKNSNNSQIAQPI